MPYCVVCGKEIEYSDDWIPASKGVQHASCPIKDDYTQGWNDAITEAINKMGSQYDGIRIIKMLDEMRK